MKCEFLKKTLRIMDNLGSQWSGLLLVMGLLLTVAFLYIDRHQAISDIIRSKGWLGIVVAIVLIALISMTPIPTESLTVMCLKAYGIGWGTFYSWVGSTLSAVAIFWLVRSIGEPLRQKVISHESFKQVNEWIIGKGSIGLLIARLLPLPAFIVNYITAVIPAIRFWGYLWTAALTIIPSYLVTAMIFMGVTAKLRIWLVVGGLGMVLIWFSSYLLNRYQTLKATC